jgi:hypothetical protein
MPQIVALPHPNKQLKRLKSVRRNIPGHSLKKRRPSPPLMIRHRPAEYPATTR